MKIESVVYLTVTKIYKGSISVNHLKYWSLHKMLEHQSPNLNMSASKIHVRSDLNREQLTGNHIAYQYTAYVDISRHTEC